MRNKAVLYTVFQAEWLLLNQLKQIQVGKGKELSKWIYINILLIIPNQ